MHDSMLLFSWNFVDSCLYYNFSVMNLWCTHEPLIYEIMKICMSLWSYYRWFKDHLKGNYQCYYERFSHMILSSCLWKVFLTYKVSLVKYFSFVVELCLRKIFYVLILNDVNWYWSLPFLFYNYIWLWFILLELRLAPTTLWGGGSNRRFSSPKLRFPIGLS